jgi:hypothetical protein
VTPKLEAFKHGDGAHRGLTDWYPEKEAALELALKAHAPFDTGWYGSKHEVASARIYSHDGVTIHAEASVSDDLDTEGLGSATVEAWTMLSMAVAVESAWSDAEAAQKDSQPYQGFAVYDAAGAWIETYLLSDGTYDVPPGDHYFNWGWQYAEKDGQGIPDPLIPAEAVEAFEAYVQGDREEPLTVAGWTIKRWA